MTTFPNSPRLIKGALVGVDIFNPLASVVVFQYNPDTMTRRLEARAASGDGDRGEAQRLTGSRTWDALAQCSLQCLSIAGIGNCRSRQILSVRMSPLPRMSRFACI